MCIFNYEHVLLAADDKIEDKKEEDGQKKVDTTDNDKGKSGEGTNEIGERQDEEGDDDEEEYEHEEGGKEDKKSQ